MKFSENPGTPVKSLCLNLKRFKFHTSMVSGSAEIIYSEYFYMLWTEEAYICLAQIVIRWMGEKSSHNVFSTVVGLTPKLLSQDVFKPSRHCVNQCRNKKSIRGLADLAIPRCNRKIIEFQVAGSHFECFKTARLKSKVE